VDHLSLLDHTLLFFAGNVCMLCMPAGAQGHAEQRQRPLLYAMITEGLLMIKSTAGMEGGGEPRCDVRSHVLFWGSGVRVSTNHLPSISPPITFEISEIVWARFVCATLPWQTLQYSSTHSGTLSLSRQCQATVVERFQDAFITGDATRRV